MENGEWRTEDGKWGTDFRLPTSTFRLLTPASHQLCVGSAISQFSYQKLLGGYIMKGKTNKIFRDLLIRVVLLKLNKGLFIPIIIGILLNIWCAKIFAADENVGTKANATIKIAVGARASGMGETFVGVADDVHSIYWNPAGLGQISRSQLSAMHTEWLAGVRYEWVGFAQSLGKWATIATDVAYVHTGDIIRTVELDVGRYATDGVFDYRNLAYRIAVGSGKYKHLRFGAAFHVLQQSVVFDKTKQRMPTREIQSIGVSVGVLYDMPIKNLRIGATIQNLGGGVKGFYRQEHKEAQTHIIRIGGAYEIQIKPPESELIEAEIEAGQTVKTPTNRIILATDLNIPNDSSVYVNAGLEYTLKNGFSVRFGYRARREVDFLSRFSGGFGYATSAYNVDYAFVPFGDVGNTHRVSLTLKF